MSFLGSTPLNSPGEFSITGTPPNSNVFAGYTIASGVATATQASNYNATGYLFASVTAGAQTDNCYVGVTIPATVQNYNQFENFQPGFGLDGTHFVSFYATLQSGTPSNITQAYVIINNGSGSYTNYIVYFPGVTYSGSLPISLAAGLVGTNLQMYFREGLGAWSLLGTSDLSAYVDAPTLLTWTAIMRGYVAGSPYTSTQASAMYWGPIYALIGGNGPVPDVVGLSDAAAQAALIAANMSVGSITPVVSSLPIGTVISQSPVAGTVEPNGTPVNLTESEGVLVPDVVNTSITVVAPGILAAADFIVGTITHETSGAIIAGNIISQSPAAGSFASAGSAVNVVVSSGLPALTVPDLFGLTQTDAINLLLSLGLVPGAIGSAPSQFVPPGEVQAQNPSPGAAVAVGTIVSFVLSQGIPAVGTLFDFEVTVISQYANSPTILQLCNNLNQYIDQSANFANFFNFVWNVDTAVGFGLDIWGKIVGVSRLLQIPNSTPYVGFYQPSESQPDQDWTPAGSDQPPYNNPPVGGAFYTGHNATEAYLLDDDAYRQLILAKAFANIASTTAPAINQILQNLYGPGSAWVLNTGPMAISYNLSFTPTAIQLAILEQSGVIPTPPGVSVVINTNV